MRGKKELSIHPYFHEPALALHLMCGGSGAACKGDKGISRPLDGVRIGCLLVSYKFFLRRLELFLEIISRHELFSWHHLNL